MAIRYQRLKDIKHKPDVCIKQRSFIESGEKQMCFWNKNIEDDMIIFQSRSFWNEMGVPEKLVKKRFKYFFGDKKEK